MGLDFNLELETCDENSDAKLKMKMNNICCVPILKKSVIQFSKQTSCASIINFYIGAELSMKTEYFNFVDLFLFQMYLYDFIPNSSCIYSSG